MTNNILSKNTQKMLITCSEKIRRNIAPKEIKRQNKG